MKKLESIKGATFVISEKEKETICGGLKMGEFSLRYYVTHNGDGNSSNDPTDAEAYDYCF